MKNFVTALRIVAVLAIVLWFFWPSNTVRDGAPEGLALPDTALGSASEPESGEELTSAAPVPTRSVLQKSEVESRPTPVEPEELFEIEEESEDLIEQGACGLSLVAIWADSGEALATHFRLYRLDAPENEFFEAGDQVQFEGELPPSGRQLRLLPAGRYRAACWVGAEGSDDPPAFTVTGEQTEITLRLVRPRAAHARLRLFDDNGLPVLHVDRRRTVHEAAQTSTPPLAWVKWRAPKSGYVTSEGMVSFGDDGGWPVEHLAAELDGIPLGEIRAPGKVEPHRSRQFLGLPEHSDVIVPLTWDGEAEPTWAALIVPLERITGSLWFEYGDRPRLDLLQLEATCTARPIAGLPQLEPWAPLGIEVQASYPGYQTLRFRWVPGDGPLADHFLIQEE